MHCRSPFYILCCLCCICCGQGGSPTHVNTAEEIGYLAVDTAASTAAYDTAFTIEGDEYLNFSATDLATGMPTQLSELIEGRLALVDFWSSWCRPCRQQIRDRLSAVYADYADDGVVVVGVAVQDDSTSLRHAIDELGVEWPQLFDDQGKAVKAYHLATIPHLMLVSANGTVLAWDLHEAAIEAALDNALLLDDDEASSALNGR